MTTPPVARSIRSYFVPIFQVSVTGHTISRTVVHHTDSGKHDTILHAHSAVLRYVRQYRSAVKQAGKQVREPEMSVAGNRSCLLLFCRYVERIIFCPQ